MTSAIRPATSSVGAWGRHTRAVHGSIGASSSEISRVLGPASVVLSATIDVSSGISHNIANNEPTRYIISDAIVDTAISGTTSYVSFLAGAWAATKAGALMGGKLGTIVPIKGNIAGAIAGAAIGFLGYLAFDVVPVGGFTIREHLHNGSRVIATLTARECDE